MENLFGRQILYTSEEVINRENILDVLSSLYSTHETNVAQIDYLYDYFKGNQDVLQRTKEFNDYVLNKIVENRAAEIVNFKTAYLVGDAIKYSANDQKYADLVDVLNDYCRLEGKETKDYDLVEWMNIAGTSYRLVLPKTDEMLKAELSAMEESEEGAEWQPSPFMIESLDPRTAFVAYTTRIPHTPKLAAYVTTDSEGVQTFSVYVKNPDGNKFYEIRDDNIVDEQDYALSELPIIEYPKGKARIGAFEGVITLLNAINSLDSDRLDGVDQAIQSLLVLINCKLPDGANAGTIKEMGLVELVTNETQRAEIRTIATNLDQTNTQTLKEDLLQAIRTIVSMPNVSAGNTSGDNGLAVLYRNGWEGAYESAMTDQKNMDRPEYMSIKLMLEICRLTNTFSLPIRVIDIDYTRQHYENMATKSQVLISLLNNDKVAPKVAYEVCGLFYDPNKKYLEGMSWYEEQLKRQGQEATVTEPEDTEGLLDENNSNETAQEAV